MKKIYGACVALLLCLVLALSGCKPGISEVLDYLKSNREFKEGRYESNKYTVEFIVEDDLSYSLKLSDPLYKELKDYSATGTLKYLGSYEDSGSYVSWGVTNNYKYYYYVIKLDGATVSMNLTDEDREYNFYLIVDTSADRKDFSPNIVRHVADDGSEEEGCLQNIGKYGYSLSCKNK